VDAARAAAACAVTGLWIQMPGTGSGVAY